MFQKGNKFWKKKKKFTHSKESREKISKAKKGKSAWNKGMSGVNGKRIGFKHSPETKERIRQTSIGKKQSKETIEKRVRSRSGYKHSEETKRKMAEKAKERGISKWILEKAHQKNKGRKLSKEHRKKISEKLKNRREKSNLWKGGTTPINQIIRSSLEYKLWREEVFKRDNYTCVWCGMRSGNGKTVILNADHIKPFALFPELRFVLDNGRTLCKECHLKTDTHGRNKSKLHARLKNEEIKGY